MKKTGFVSPFIMLIIPVVFFIGLSLALNVTKSNDEISTTANKIEVIQKVSIKTLLSSLF
ncbi:hypothetical protein [Pseudopedobacter beijingensis]|uniref:Uncharacterized protein n=1 Tax=Pseudopedobacter beijingensis TaxID=1207056 RepID=A0ABW4IAV6_9SPHI